MEANLTGIDFEIRQITPTRQPVGAAVTEWKWQVRPTEAGKRDLQLTLTAIISINGQETSYAVRTFARTLEVRTVPVSPGRRVTRFFEDNWQWLLTTLLIPLAVWAYRRRATQRPATAKPQAKRKKVKR